MGSAAENSLHPQVLQRKRFFTPKSQRRRLRTHTTFFYFGVCFFFVFGHLFTVRIVRNTMMNGREACTQSLHCKG